MSKLIVFFYFLFQIIVDVSYSYLISKNDLYNINALSILYESIFFQKKIFKVWFVPNLIENSLFKRNFV